VSAADEVVVPLAALEHHSYCPRQCALIHVDGLWFDNEHTVRGVAGHNRVDTAPTRQERGATMLRHIPLWSEEHGLAGRADAVALARDGSVVPVEYKVGVRHGMSAHLQLCAQALCIEEMFEQEVPLGFVWYTGTRRRERVPLDHDLRAFTLRAVAEIRDNLVSDRLPEAVDDQRCQTCQFLDHCQPHLSAHPELVAAYLTAYVRCAS
jgi:CRISPR-associated exonuclease Cas4